MIIAEKLNINGREFVRTYSDSGFLLERDGVRYSEAIDPAEFDRIYIETNEAAGEATDADYQAALREMGVRV